MEHSINNDKYKAPKGKEQTHRVLITNMESATECTGKAMGTCQLEKDSDCYAWRAEKRFPKCLAYRERQTEEWATHNAEYFIDAIEGIQRRAKKKITHHRLNESGEMKTGGDLYNAMKIARKNKDIGIKTFIYTTRQTMMENTENDWKDSCLVVNGSGWMADNEYRVVPEGYVAQKNEYWCPDKCYNRSMCKEKLGITILSPIRKAGKTAKRNSK